MTNITKLPLPKLSEAEAAAYHHDSYLMQIREQLCTACGCGEKWSELFEVWAHPYHTRHTRAVQLRSTTVIRLGFAVAYTALAKVEVPVCSECIETFKPQEGALLPAISHSAWLDTVRRKYTPEPVTKQGRPEPTLDSL